MVNPAKHRKEITAEQRQRIRWYLNHNITKEDINVKESLWGVMAMHVLTQTI